MRISHFLNEHNVNLEERKRVMQRKEMSETYKKNASFLQASKNPMLEMLENLLSGKTEKEMHENISSMDEGASYIEEETTNTDEKEGQLEQISTAEFELRKHSLQDLLIGESASAQFQQMTSQISSENNFEVNDEEPFVNERIDFNLPEHLTKDFNWNANREKIFGKGLESLIIQRTYKKAVSKYTFQMQMAEKGFHLFKPTFSQIA